MKPWFHYYDCVQCGMMFKQSPVIIEVHFWLLVWLIADKLAGKIVGCFWTTKTQETITYTYTALRWAWPEQWHLHWWPSYLASFAFCTYGPTFEIGIMTFILFLVALSQNVYKLCWLIGHFMLTIYVHNRLDYLVNVYPNRLVFFLFLFLNELGSH